MARLRSGERFKELARKVASGYKKAGKSSKEAENIGKATAAKIGRKKYGKARFQEMAK